MTRLLEWLLDLDGIRLAEDAPVYLRWGQKPEGWMLLLLAGAAVAMIVIIHRSERISLPRRSVLVLCRCATLAVVVALMFQPLIVLERNRQEPSHVALLVDASASMATVDDGDDDRSRLAQVQDALRAEKAAPLHELIKRNDVELASFAGVVHQHGMATGPEDVGSLCSWLGDVQADGQGTNLAESVADVLRRAQGRRLAGIVLASDGQATSAGGLGPVLAELRRRQIPVYAIRVGSPVPPRNVELGPIRAPRQAYAGDAFTVEVPVAATGIAEPTEVAVALKDESTGMLIAEGRVTLDREVTAGTAWLEVQASAAGRYQYRIEAVPLEGERIADDNVGRFETNVLDNQVRVLYVEGYPRYEYRYLKNALLREPTISLSVLLIEADEQFVQEGTESIRHFPRTPDDLGRFDVVIFGDVDPRAGWLSRAQANMLLDFVGNEGGGFALIAGERAAPHRFARTPLSKLVPVRIDPTFLGRYAATLTEGFSPVLTLDGRRLGLFAEAAGSVADAGSKTATRDPLQDRPPLYWVSRSLGPRPGAVVLVEHPTMSVPPDPGREAHAMPVAVAGQYGAGRLYYQATDDTWRWRRHRVGEQAAGELMHDTYWVKVVRMLARPPGTDDRQGYDLRADRRTYPYGAPMRLQLTVRDSQRLDQLGDTVALLLTGADEQAGTSTSRFHAFRTAPASRVFEGVCTASRPGRYEVSLPPDTQWAADEDMTRQVVDVLVKPPDLETRRLEADHEQLGQLARATGGEVLGPDELVSGFAEILDRSAEIPDDVVEPLWDSKLAIILFLGLITMDWIVRKAYGLL